MNEVITASPATTLAPAANPFEKMALAIVTGGSDLAKLDTLLDMQIKWDKEQARKSFVAAMADFKATPTKIEKGKLVRFTTRDGDTTEYRHATLADVVDASVSGMGAHGLAHRWEVVQDAGQVRVTCVVSHRDGHSESVTMQAAPDNSGKKNAIQQIASTVTYLERYTLMAALGLAAHDMAEDDGRGYAAKDENTKVTAEQAAELQALSDQVVTNPDAFLSWLRKGCKDETIETLADVPAKNYPSVRARLNEMLKEKTA